MNFRDNVAIVTGGAAGIGKAFTTSLLDSGMKVCFCDMNEDNAKKYIESLPNDKQGKVIFQKCDVASFDQLKVVFERTFSNFGRIDLVINNAGITDDSMWRKEIEVNLVGTMNGIKLALEYMDIRNGGHGGHVINVSSISGLIGSQQFPVYAATKGGIIILTKSYGCDYFLKTTGITFNAICPGAVNTEAYEKAVDITKTYILRFKTCEPELIADGLHKILRDGVNGKALLADIKGLRYSQDIEQEIIMKDGSNGLIAGADRNSIRVSYGEP